MSVEGSRRWLVGLRRAWIDSGSLESWVEDRDVGGVVWTPAAYEVEDVAEALHRLVGSGARPDDSLLWDLALADVQSAADVLAPLHRASDGNSGYVVVWLDPDSVSGGDRAVEASGRILSDVGRPRRNVAVGLAWHAKRESVVEALARAGVAVALSNLRDPEARQAAARAHERGSSGRRAEDSEEGEQPAAPPIFLFGGPNETLCTEFDLFVDSRSTGRLPLSPDAERAGLQAAVERLEKRASHPVRADAYTPEFFARAVAVEIAELDDDDVLEDVWARDHTIWNDDPTEIADRLGWLEIADAMSREAEDIAEFGRKARAGAGIKQVVLCGMGGSVLGAHTLASVAGSGIPLKVLDTTHPDAIASFCEGLDWAHTLVVIGSKSGATIETRSHLEYLWSKSGRADRFVAVTDPGTELAVLAKERGFARVFESPPDIGGRFSALSHYGLVPAALAGTDIRPILHSARRAMAADAPGVAPGASPGTRLGAALAEAQMKEDRDKLTLVLPKRLASFGAWIEQLVAESTGKAGTGILPVVGEEMGPPDVYGPDRMFCAYVDAGTVPAELEALSDDHPIVTITTSDSIGSEIFRWEMATALIGYMLDINPFDQPDVEAAKHRAREALGASGHPEPGDPQAALDGLSPPAYLAIQAFLAPTDESRRRLDAVRLALRARHGVAVTVGFGPGFLHSTGQLHKGGPPTGVFVQVTDDPKTDIEVPGMGFSFGRLLRAQADGDLLALREAGRSAIRVSLGRLEEITGVG